MPTRIKTFRPSLLAGRRLIGLFTRLMDPTVVEMLAQTRLDFAVLDVEHGSLDRHDIDRIAFAAATNDLPLIVRVADSSPAGIHHALAVGAAGVIVPHITSGDEAQAVAAFARSAALERSFAGMGRAAEYRKRSWPEFRAAARDRLVVIAQIDEPAGADRAEDIAAVADLDCVFMGTLSLALALGAANAREPNVEQALVRICSACQRAGRRVGMHLQQAEAQAIWTGRGVNLFVGGNDLTLLRDGAERIVAGFEAAHQPSADAAARRGSAPPS